MQAHTTVVCREERGGFVEQEGGYVGSKAEVLLFGGDLYHHLTVYHVRIIHVQQPHTACPYAGLPPHPPTLPPP